MHIQMSDVMIQGSNLDKRYVLSAIAVAAHLEPEILIVDEVLAVG